MEQADDEYEWECSCSQHVGDTGVIGTGSVRVEFILSQGSSC